MSDSVSKLVYGGFEGIVFDAYGMLFDLAALETACAIVTTDPVALAHLWRTKQVDYTILRTVLDSYSDWGQITSDALDYACAVHAVQPTPLERRLLMRSWVEMPAYPDVHEALDALVAADVRMAILSNAPRYMLDNVLLFNNLIQHFGAIMTAEHVQAFKPDVSMYLQVSERFQARMNEILFVTTNGFDVAGAKAVGMTVCYVNRDQLPLDPLGYEPDFTVRDLAELNRLLLGE